MSRVFANVVVYLQLIYMDGGIYSRSAAFRRRRTIRRDTIDKILLFRRAPREFRNTMRVEKFSSTVTAASFRSGRNEPLNGGVVAADGQREVMGQGSAIVRA